MVLEFENGERITISAAWQVEELLDQLGQEGKAFVILTAPNGHYLQASGGKPGHVIEKQLGGLSEHYRANKKGKIDRFSLSDVKQAARDFFEDQSSDAGLQWEECDLKQESEILDPDDLPYFIQTYGDNRAARWMWQFRRLENFIFPTLIFVFSIIAVLGFASKLSPSP